MYNHYELQFLFNKIKISLICAVYLHYQKELYGR